MGEEEEGIFSSTPPGLSSKEEEKRDANTRVTGT